MNFADSAGRCLFCSEDGVESSHNSEQDYLQRQPSRTYHNRVGHVS